jgi:tripartite-type tricarboxylate transporter receptor subunit TctC
MYRTAIQNLFIPLTITGALLGTSAQAQEYPLKPVTIVLVLAAGTGLDVAVRTWGVQLAQTLAAPSATPRLVVNRLHAEMTRIMKLPEVNKAISNLDLIPLTPASVEDTQQYIAAETKKWGDLVRKLGLAGSQ